MIKREGRLKGWRDGCRAYGLLARMAEPPPGSELEYAEAWKAAQMVCWRSDRGRHITVTLIGAAK